MSLIYFIVVLGVIVLVHELGHLITAKIFKVYCYEFSIGMGPKIHSWKGKETVYSLRLIPLGGYVAMAGEKEEELEMYPNIEIPKGRSLASIKPWKKIIVLVAGAVMNFVLAWIIVAGIFIQLGAYPEPRPPVVAGVVEGGPAELAGFQTGDYITGIVFDDGTIIKPKTFNDILAFTQSYAGEMTYTVERGSKELELSVQPQQDENGIYLVGIMLPEQKYAKVNLISGFKYGAEYLIDLSKVMMTSMGHLLVGKGLDQMSGPVGIYQATAQQANYGLRAMLLWIAILSLNVGIFNLFPLPVLDGGRIILTGIEWVTKKPINKKIETGLMVGSMVLVLMLFIFVTWQDIIRLF